jgi:hypothetical protein
VSTSHLRKERRVAPLAVHVRDGEKSVELVEAHVLGLRLDVLPEVPLADGLGGVAGLRQELGERDFPLEATRFAIHGRALKAVASRHASGQEGGPRRGARRLGIARRQAQALSGQAIDGRGRRPHRDTTAIAAEVAPADVVEQDEEDVRPAPRAGGEVGQPALRRRGLLGEDEGRLAVGGGGDGRAGDRIERRHDTQLATRGFLATHGRACSSWAARRNRVASSP